MTIAVPVHRALTTKLAGRSFNVVTRLGYNPWLARVPHNTDTHEPTPTSSRSQSSRIYAITPRSYATSTARKPAGRPKAHTGRTPAKRTTKAATAKKPGPKTAAGKAKVGAKPKAKKAKAKPKKAVKKTVKKAPTKSALNKERVAKEKSLKEAALLNPPKALPANAWAVYFTEAQKGKHSFDRSGQITKEAAQNFKDITPEQKEV